MSMNVDHLMWGAPDLDTGIAAAAQLFGLDAVPGGAHPGLGTRNALVGLDDGRYLEIIAPDPAQSRQGTFGEQLAGLEEPALITWALSSRDLQSIAGRLTTVGYRPRGPVRTERTTPAGVHLAWDLLFVGGHPFGPRFPFFIDWLECAHPSTTLPSAGRLAAISIGTADAHRFGALLADVDVPMTVTEATEPFLRVTIETARGRVTLVSTPQAAALRFG
jgi:hypothetical protein